MPKFMEIVANIMPGDFGYDYNGDNCWIVISKVPVDDGYTDIDFRMIFLISPVVKDGTTPIIFTRSLARKDFIYKYVLS